MMTNKRFEYSSNEKITAIRSDLTNSAVWVAFEQNADGDCIIERQSAFQPKQNYFSIDRAVTRVNAMDLNDTYLYVAYTDSSLLGQRLSLANPLTTITNLNKQTGINERAVDVKVNGTDVWFLTPGDTSGENAKLVNFLTAGSFVQTVDLTKMGSTVTNARSFTIDDNGDIWVVTYNDPAELVRVFEGSGGIYDFTINTFI